MKILVVDDAPEVVESVRLGLMLQWREVEVIGAGDGELALELVEREAPDLVLLDVGLPGSMATACSSRFGCSPMCRS